MSEIKLGDVVRLHPHWLQDAIVGVVGVLDDGWATLAFYAPVIVNGTPCDELAPIDTPVDDLSYERAGTEEELRTAVVMIAQRKTGYQRTLARKEALARGWRELDAEDVEDKLIQVAFHVDGQFVGSATLGDRGRWYWVHWPDGDHQWDSGSTATKDEAKAKVIQAENARRAAAKEQNGG